MISYLVHTNRSRWSGGLGCIRGRTHRTRRSRMLILLGILVPLIPLTLLPLGRTIRGTCQASTGSFLIHGSII